MNNSRQTKSSKCIWMTGINHETAALKIREKFSFTRRAAFHAMEKMKTMPGVKGCILLSTCNRTEIYISGIMTQSPMDLCSLLCHALEIDKEDYRRYFTEKTGEEVIRHLFFLAAGLKSKIVGEDQILTQVGDALSLAREAHGADTVLEVLFRHAVTAGKKVKTQVPMQKENESAAALSLKRLLDLGYEIRGKTCMVIGNGMMGKLTALALKEEGADVTVTVRQYKSGMVEIPKGCNRIHYGERYWYLPKCDFVFSATASPNVTITKEEVLKAGWKKPVVFVDLAVPRDIEPKIRELGDVSLYDIDDFSIDACSDAMEEQYKRASDLLEKKIEEYENWYANRNSIPVIRQIGKAAAEDAAWRMGKIFQSLTEKGKEETLREGVVDCVGKTVRHMLFSLRDELSPEELEKVLKILEEEYGQ